MIGIAIGNFIGKGSSGSRWTPQKIAATFLFFASHPTDILNKVVATQLPNQVQGSSDYFTVTGSGLNAHYRTPNNDTYRTADSDYVFWKTDASESTCDGNRLIAYDLQRVPVKYSDSSPYTIQMIGILKTGVTLSASELNQLFQYFALPVEWHNDTNAFGHIKSNRTGQNLWVPESINPAIPAGLAATLISGGVKWDWTAGDGAAQTEVWCRNDSDAYTTATYTIAAGTVTKSETVTPVDLRYCKIRSLKDGLYSAFTVEVSIAMLSAEMISNGTFADGTGWTVANPPWAISGGKANYTTGGGSNCVYTSATLTLNSHYRFKFNISGRTTTANMTLLDAGGGWIWGTPFNGWANYANGDYSYNIICTVASVAFAIWGQGGSGSFSVDNVSCKKILMP